MTIRPQFMEFFQGWATVDSIDDITERIERSAEWVRMNGGTTAEEGVYIKFFIEVQLTRAMKEGWHGLC